MLGGLIEANLQQHPERAALLKPAIIAIHAPDADVTVGIRLHPNEVIIRNGEPQSRADLRVTADSTTLIELSGVPLKFGLPDSMTKEGREVTKKLLKRELKVRGMLGHAGTLSRFNRLLSVR